MTGRPSPLRHITSSWGKGALYPRLRRSAIISCQCNFEATEKALRGLQTCRGGGQARRLRRKVAARTTLPPRSKAHSNSIAPRLRAAASFNLRLSKIRYLP